MKPLQKAFFGIVAMIIMSTTFVIICSFIFDAYKQSNKTFSAKEVDKHPNPNMEGKTCIATIYIPNGTSREFKIDSCTVDRNGGYVQFKSNGKYILLEGTVVLEEK